MKTLLQSTIEELGKEIDALQAKLEAAQEENEQFKKACVESELFSSRITDYLALGGLFNPEFMEHEKVRDILITSRDCLARLAALVKEGG